MLACLVVALLSAWPEGAQWRAVDVGNGTDFALEQRQETVDGVWRGSCTISDPSGGERAVTLCLAIPLDATGWTWWDDPERHRTISGDQPFQNVVDGFFTYQYMGSQYPLTVLSNGDKAYCLAVPLRPARIPRFVYDPVRRELRAEFDFGLSPIPEQFPSRADATVLAFEVPASWAFRRALERYYALYPEALNRRAKTGGTFLTKSPIDSIEHPEDFGFAWNDFEANLTQFAEADERAGVLSFIYREPQTNWRALKENTERSYENYVTQLREDAQNGDRKAQATLVSGVERADGRMDLYTDPIVWATAAPFGTNADPAVPTGDPAGWPNKGQYELENLGKALGWTGEPTHFDGVMYDSMEGWANLLNYSKAHWRTTSHPLTFDRNNGNKVCLSNLWGNYAFAEALSKGLRAHGQLMIGNGAFHFLWAYAPFVDIPGREYNWYVDGKWAPLPDERFLFLRSLAYERPCWVMMNDPFDDASHLEEYFQRCLFYGVFPTMFHAHTGTSVAYFLKPEYYNRDRHLFVKYVPLIKRLDEAGWRPVPFATASPEAVRIERYGDFTANTLAFSLHNLEAQEMSVTLRLLRQELGITSTPKVEEWIAGREVTVENAGAEVRVTLTLPAGSYAVVGVKHAAE
jgi:hypothetical protein